MQSPVVSEAHLDEAGRCRRYVRLSGGFVYAMSFGDEMSSWDAVELSEAGPAVLPGFPPTVWAWRRKTAGTSSSETSTASPTRQVTSTRRTTRQNGDQAQPADPSQP